MKQKIPAIYASIPARLYAAITKKSKIINKVRTSNHLLESLLIFNKISMVQINKCTLMSPYLYNKRVTSLNTVKVSKNGK